MVFAEVNLNICYDIVLLKIIVQFIPYNILSFEYFTIKIPQSNKRKKQNCCGLQS